MLAATAVVCALVFVGAQYQGDSPIPARALQPHMPAATEKRVRLVSSAHGGAVLPATDAAPPPAATALPPRAKKPAHVSGEGNTPPQFVLATGASSDHACWLLNLLSGLKRFHPDWPVVVYDLGIAGDLDASLVAKAHPGDVRVRRFEYQRFPAFFNITAAAGEYAWKPAIIKELVDEFGKVLWLDSGNGVGKRDNLTEVLAVLDTVGFYSPASVGTVQEWTYPETLEYLKVSTKQTESWTNCNGAIVGFGKDTPAYSAVLVPWYQCALDKDCIAPAGSDRSNHRQDQAALTVIAAREGYSCYPYCRTGCGGISLHQDGRAAVINTCRLLGMAMPSKQKKKKKQRPQG